MSGKFALIIGNTEYTDPGLAQLAAPGKDAEDFARILQDEGLCAFDDVNLILNQPEYIVRGAIDEFFDQKKPDDLLVLYFSGHGVRDELGALYLAVKNTIHTRLRSTAIKSDYIREAMDQSRSKRQVLILDCCNSGAFEQGTKAATGVSIGTASAFEAGYGRIILTASDSTQFAWEGNKVIGNTDNSLFTHFLVTGLKGEADLDSDGRITVDELYDYTYEKVKFATPKQTPSKFSSKQQGEIVLRQITRIEDIKPVSLSDQLSSEIENPYPEVRLRAVGQLARLLNGKNLGLARSAREALERIEKEDDSRTVSRAALRAMEAIRQAEQLALQKAEEERLVAEKLETERLLVEQKAEEERKAKEETERFAHARTKRERAEYERAPQKPEREIVKRVTRTGTEKGAYEAGARTLAQIKDKLNQLRTYGKAKWGMFVNHSQRMLKNTSKIYITFGLAIPFIAIIVFLFYQQFNTPALFFSGYAGGEIHIYSYNDNSINKITASTNGMKNWSPTVDPYGRVYFTSNRTGKAEIYLIKDDGQAQQITQTSGTAESWSPAVDLYGRMYFTSNRTGKAEIYLIKDDGHVQQITQTSGTAESWSPTVDPYGRVYFTSNRTGKAEIYLIKDDGHVQQMTNTPGSAGSWSPAVDLYGRVYFTSNRTGKAEIYLIKDDGHVQQMTNTPGSAGSWSPVIRGKNIYFTSDRDYHNYIYLLDGTQAIKISSSESWTTTLSAKSPSPRP